MSKNFLAFTPLQNTRIGAKKKKHGNVFPWQPVMGIQRPHITRITPTATFVFPLRLPLQSMI